MERLRSHETVLTFYILSALAACGFALFASQGGWKGYLGWTVAAMVAVLSIVRPKVLIRPAGILAILLAVQVAIQFAQLARWEDLTDAFLLGGGFLALVAFAIVTEVVKLPFFLKAIGLFGGFLVPAGLAVAVACRAVIAAGTGSIGWVEPAGWVLIWWGLSARYAKAWRHWYKARGNAPFVDFTALPDGPLLDI